MNIVKFNKDRKNNDIKISYDGGQNFITYKAYTICNIPPSFGTQECTEYLKYKGLIYIAK